MVIRVPPSKDNGLLQYSNAYLSEEKFKKFKDEPKKSKGVNKRFVVMEMQNREPFDSIFNTMMKDNTGLITALL